MTGCNTGFTNKEEPSVLRHYWIAVAITALFSGAAHGREEANDRRPTAAPATLRVFTVPGRPGETCVILVDAKNTPLMRQCSYGAWTT